MNSALCIAVAATLLTLAGCGKKDEAASGSGTAAPGATGAAALAPGEVASYPNQVVQSGTVRLLQRFAVHQAADASSPKLSDLAVGTHVNLKASYSNWMLVEWPSGVGQLSPGWIQLKSINDSRVQVEQKDAGAPAVVDAGQPAVDAGAPAATDAGDGRPRLRLPTKR